MYQPTKWEDKVTLIDAERLNKIENGISDVSSKVDEISKKEPQFVLSKDVYTKTEVDGYLNNKVSVQTLADYPTNAQMEACVGGAVVGLVTNESVKTEIAGEFSKLASVATTGSYNDLIDKPSIPESVELKNLILLINDEEVINYNGTKEERCNLQLDLTTLTDVANAINENKGRIDSIYALVGGENLTTINTAIDTKVSALGDSFDTKLGNVNTELTTKIEANASSIETNKETTDGKLSQYRAVIVSLQAQLDILSSQLANTRLPDQQDVVLENENVSNPEQNIVVSGSVTDTVRTIEAKSIQLENVSANNAKLTLTASTDVSANNISTSGDLPKSQSNSSISINNDGYVNITQSDLQQTCYNVIEVGLKTSPKSVNISDIDFGESSNNAILIFGWQKDAIINISNCHFRKVSNALRLSNKDNQPCTVYINNCTVDEWDSNPEYAGFLLLQDYSSKSLEETVAENRFANIKVVFNNVKGPNGLLVTDNPEDLCAGGTGQQAVYMYRKYGGLTNYDPEIYPKLEFRK